MKQSLNEEQLAQGKKDLGGFRHPIYKCVPRVADDSKATLVEEIFVEAERFIDARMYAERHFGVPQVVTIRYSAAPIDAFPRWQVRWAGSAASGSNDLRRQVRRVTDDTVLTGRGWKDL